jgi:hypothetical protein
MTELRLDGLRAGHERAALTIRTTGDYVPEGIPE